MALVINKNTYVTVEEADTYFNQRLSSEAWLEAESEDKEKSLIMATRVINQFRYIGRKLSNDQKLAFPRIDSSLVLNDAQLIKYNLNQDKVPEDVKYAQLEQAIYYLEGEDANRQLMDAGITSFSSNGASFSMQNDGYAALSQSARLYLKPYLTKGGRLI